MNKILSRQEREKALSVSKHEYPQDMPCAVCGYRWMQHHGTLCPIRPGYLTPVDMGDHIEMLPVAPIFGNKTFIPDVAWQNQNPDFDVQ